ncbi:hypothetical protein [Sphingopyxis fribergensis]
MNYAIVLFIIIGFFLIKYKFGYISFVSAGFFCFAVYSIPAIVGLKRSFFYGSSERYLVPVDGAPIAVTLLAWIAFVLTLAAFPRSRVATTVINVDLDYYRTKMWAAAAFAMAGLFYLMAEGGALFFIAAREEQLDDYVVLIWRWIVVIGFIAAVAGRHRVGQVIFLTLLAIIFLRGDRTIAAISAVAFLVQYFRGNNSIDKITKIVFNYKFLIGLALIIFVIVFGKPIYLSVKDGNFEILTNYLRDARISDIAFSLEPFVTFEHIPLVIDLGVHIEFREFLISILGNALLIPSAFGVETNLYSIIVTQMLPQEVSFGIAGNYWAHAMTVGWYPMVAIFAFIFALSLAIIDRNVVNKRGRLRIGILIIGAVVAVYIHRNGLDNIFSFIRQIFIASVLVHATYLILRKRTKSHVSLSRGHDI